MGRTQNGDSHVEARLPGEEFHESGRVEVDVQ